MALLVLACNGTEAPRDGTTEFCDVDLEWTVPEAGATDAYWRSDVEFHLSDPDRSAELSFTAPGAAAESEDGETLYWHLSEPLTPNTTYEATLAWCEGEETVTFTTSSFGEPLADTSLVEGATYAIDLATARIVEPPGIGAILSQQFRQKLLVSPVSASDGSITLLGAVAVEDSDPPVQDYCSATFDFLSADFSDIPYFAVTTDELNLSVAGWDLYISDASLSGTFSSDGSQLGGAVLQGLVDMYSGGETADAELYADQIHADRVAGLALAGVTGSNCDGCADGPPEEGAPCEE